ncbi:hybrid sensor histidine kinase/response regulator [Methylobacillus glycogenes]|uniref:hybrid sensor histidine kinase/response regulator n=1 Tax=Methylobacillus glycogenes TaxID=406 RepID=UPI00046F8BB1|nr:response regulator [Methylobacillus glycogenes]
MQDGQAHISVSDNGIGIAAEEQQHIFELFAQAKRDLDRSEGGLGIGLAVARKMVELHGGSIHCHSAGIGQGTRFSVSLPSVLPQEKRAEPNIIAPAMPKSGLPTIMVVDDNADGAEMLASLMNMMGYVTLVENGSHSALNTAREAQPQICILDIGLPDMDGNELARRLRAQPETANALLIAVTGYGQPGDKETSLQAGFDHYLIKPVDISSLFTLLAAETARRTPAPEAAHQ